MKNLVLVLMFLTFLVGCDLLRPLDCYEYVPQGWHFGEMEAKFNVNDSILNIGDTIHVRFELEKKLYDLDNKGLNIDQGIDIFIRITTTSDLSDTLNTDIFGIDTTIFNVFDDYFETKVFKGNLIDAYSFSCELIDGIWQLKIIYIPKKPGAYCAYIKATEFYTRDLKLDDEVCMEGDPSTFGATLIWQESEFNRINYLFQDEDGEFPSEFGFIVE
jgi:hypothetical protein